MHAYAKQDSDDNIDADGMREMLHVDGDGPPYTPMNYPNDFLRFWPAFTAGEAFDGVDDTSLAGGAGAGVGVGVG